MNIPTELQGRYRIVKLLGKGGFGAVYLAEHLQLRGKQLAIKMSFNDSAEAAEQFQFEASTLANLRHPNLPIVSDFFIAAGGKLFLVMDFIEGEELTHIVMAQRGTLDEAQVIDWMKEVCGAVAYLHEQSPPIIHRDIKPPNIKITPDNRPILVDFGIAKRFNPSKRTARIAKAFSPGFSPSEQYIGTTDARSDVYALGATLYCMLTGVVPPDAFHARLKKNKPLQPPREINPTISAAVEAAVMRSMAMNPKFRFADARAFLRALAAIDLTTGVRCPLCGFVNRPNTHFCVRDGTSLTPMPTIAHKIPSSSPISRHTASRHASQGADYLRAGVLTRAAAEFEQAIRYETQNTEYLHLLGVAYMGQGRLQEALTVAEKAEALNSAEARHKQLIGQLYMRLNKLTDAYAAYERAIACNPKIAAIYNEFGHIAFTLGKNKTAFDAFKVAAALEPESADAFIGAAQILHHLQDYKQARALIERALQRDSTNAFAYNLFGLILHCLQEYPAAIKAQEQAMQLDPHNATYVSNVAVSYLAMNNRWKAKRMVRKALEIDPANSQAKQLLHKI